MNTNNDSLKTFNNQKIDWEHTISGGFKFK